MIRFILFFLLISFFKTSTSIAQNDLSSLQPKVVYGKDNRREFYEVKNTKVQNLALSTVAFFDMFSLNPINSAETLFEIDARTLQEDYNLCSTERYLNQPTGAFCSGFLIAPDIIVSAGHCITSQSDCESTQFVFDYKLTTKEQTQIHIPKSSIYLCNTLLSRSESINLDYSIIKLDRKVTDRVPLKFRTQDTIKTDTPVFVMGHPSGIPLKITQDGATATSSETETYFLANLDTFQGNSGSAVLNSQTHEIEGILVRGETDYSYNSEEACYKVNTCKPKDTCFQEGVIKITSLQKEINKALKLEDNNSQPDAPDSCNSPNTCNDKEESEGTDFSGNLPSEDGETEDGNIARNDLGGNLFSQVKINIIDVILSALIYFL